MENQFKALFSHLKAVSPNQMRSFCLHFAKKSKEIGMQLFNGSISVFKNTQIARRLTYSKLNV